MISFLEGKVLKFNKSERGAYVDLRVTGQGIGYRVSIPARIVGVLVGDEVTLYTSFQVREDSQSLYGFLSEIDRDMFEVLLGVSGVGPKSAMALLSAFDAQSLAELILSSNDKMLSTVPGIGGKGAKRIVLELQGKKMTRYAENRSDNGDESRFAGGVGANAGASEKLVGELEDALVALGFKGKELEKMVKRGGEIVNNEESGGNDNETVPKLKIEDLIKRILTGR